MRDNERDVLMALAAEIRASLGNGATVSTRRRWAIEIEALAAPAEGGQGEVPCSQHPDAPHGFNRNASHSEDRYVCDCEGWVPPAEGDGAVAKRWPFVESPGEFTARLEAAMRELPLIGAVRNVLIENPPTLARPAATAVVPEGFVLVPIEPTIAMVSAVSEFYAVRYIYDAMLAAAPAAPKGGVVVGERSVFQMIAEQGATGEQP